MRFLALIMEALLQLPETGPGPGLLIVAPDSARAARAAAEFHDFMGF